MSFSARGVRASQIATADNIQVGNLALATLSKRDSGILLLAFIDTFPKVISRLFLRKAGAWLKILATDSFL
jgi:hypothetical protein